MASVFKENIYHIRPLSPSPSLSLSPSLCFSPIWSLLISLCFSISLVHIVSVYISFDTKYRNIEKNQLHQFSMLQRKFSTHFSYSTKGEASDYKRIIITTRRRTKSKNVNKSFFVCRWMALSICNHHRHHYYHQHRFSTGNLVHSAETWYNKKE